MLMRRGAVARLALMAIATVLSHVAFAQDPAGTWQGTIDAADKDLGGESYVFRLHRLSSGRWVADVVIDQDWGMRWPVSEASIEGRRIRFAVPSVGSAYRGEISEDGNSMGGIWSAGPTVHPLRLTRATPATLWRETTHSTAFVTVQQGIELEVLDWGGSGRALVLLAGAGNTAHVFSRLAARLRSHYHVYGITRRGFGASSVPMIPAVPASSITMLGPQSFELRPFPDNPYDADRLGDDVIKVLDSLRIVTPVLVGHSIAGEELSSVATRYPDRIAGLIYIDALQEYAFSDGRSTDALFTAQHPIRCRPGSFRGVDCPLSPNMDPRRPSQDAALMLGMHEYRHMGAVPALAIFALPHRRPVNVRTAAQIADFDAFQQRQLARIHRIAGLLPTFRILNIPYASHEIWESNEAQVVRDINNFVATLPR